MISQKLKRLGRQARKSKTMLFNVGCTVAASMGAVLEANFSMFQTYISPKTFVLTLMIVNGVNVVLRLVQMNKDNKTTDSGAGVVIVPKELNK